MKVLLTGASGFVGSHILEDLCTQAIPTAILLRQSSNPRLIAPLLPQVQIHYGSLADPVSLRTAFHGVSHVIHCAGLTKAVRSADYAAGNANGTRNLVIAANQASPPIQRLVYISSLAASHPALPTAPAREDDPPDPVSAYGRSKLAGERVIKEQCRCDYVILRPAAVYGPGDTDFLMLFKAVKARLCPLFQRGRQPVSLVFVKDLSAAIVKCLTHPAARGRTYNVASAEIANGRDFIFEIARLLNVNAHIVSLPRSLLWLTCAARELISRVTGVPHILSREKFKELAAPGWVCEASRLRAETGFAADTSLRAGLAATLAWYRARGWLT